MTTPAASSMVYPETDGMPLPDGEFQAPLCRRIVSDLYDHFSGVPGARVNGDTFIYFVEGNPRRSVFPDCPKPRRHRCRWRETTPICCRKWARRRSSAWR